MIPSTVTLGLESVNVKTSGGQCDLCRQAEQPSTGQNTYPSSLGALLQQNDIRSTVTASHSQRMVSIIVTRRYIDIVTSAKTKPIEKFDGFEG